MEIVEHQWGPERKKLPLSVDHRGWRWTNKSGSTAYQLLAVKGAQDYEGLLAAKRKLWTNRAGDAKLLYVAYIEVAPWNMMEYPDGQRHKGIGRNLLAGAILLSQSTSANGGICLHSLDQARLFYRRWGMNDFGPDERMDDLAYFELSAEAATQFLNEWKGN